MTKGAEEEKEYRDGSCVVGLMLNVFLLGSSNDDDGGAVDSSCQGGLMLKAFLFGGCYDDAGGEGRGKKPEYSEKVHDNRYCHSAACGIRLQLANTPINCSQQKRCMSQKLAEKWQSGVYLFIFFKITFRL